MPAGHTAFGGSISSALTGARRWAGARDRAAVGA